MHGIYRVSQARNTSNYKFEASNLWALIWQHLCLKQKLLKKPEIIANGDTADRPRRRQLKTTLKFL